MISKKFLFQTIILLLIPLFALLISACSSAPAEEAPASDAAEPSESAAPEISPRILFSSDLDGNSEIFVMNADGTDQRQLTYSEAIYIEADSDDPSWWQHVLQATDPTWSPDNQRIAFIFAGEVYSMNADGSDIRRLTDDMSDTMSPTYAPDGQQIAFISNQDGDREIWIMDVDGTDLHQLTDNHIADDMPAWSPDGHSVAYYSGFPPAIQLINTDGEDPQPLINGKEGHGWQPAWSPNGKQIAFVSPRDGDDEIFVVNVDGSDLRQITDNSDKDGSPTWSSDGLQLAFTSDRDGDLEIYVMNIDGSDVRQLTDNNVQDVNPVWSSHTWPDESGSPSPIVQNADGLESADS